MKSHIQMRKIQKSEKNGKKINGIFGDDVMSDAIDLVWHSVVFASQDPHVRSICIFIHSALMLQQIFMPPMFLKL